MKNMDTEKMKLQFNEIVSKCKQFFGFLGKISVIAALLSVGFIAGNVWTAYKAKMQSQTMQPVKQAEQTSVALNERGEMMIINRSTGKYEIYADTVGYLIFNLYAAKMHYSKINPNSTETVIETKAKK